MEKAAAGCVVLLVCCCLLGGGQAINLDVSNEQGHAHHHVHVNTHAASEGLRKKGFTPRFASIGLENVRLEGLHNFALSGQNLNLEYMHMLDPDRLLYNFRVNARLPTNDTKPYGGWVS